MRPIDLPVGSVFGRLTVLKMCKDENRRVWKCRCSCGVYVFASSSELRLGAITSCGCRKADQLRKMSTTHGKSKLPEHKVWENMISRCECKNTPYYKHYGGRGIKVCKEWRQSFEAFLNDMGQRPTPRHEIDRYPDNDGDYTPGNCRWATRKEQLRNMRVTRMLTVDGVTKSIAEWAELVGLDRDVIKQRLNVGNSPYDAVYDEKWAQQKRQRKRKNK